MATTEADVIPDVDDATQRWEEFEQSLDALPDTGSEDDFLSADIPVKSASVNLRALHPQLRARLRAAFEDRRIASLARVSSGVRTYEQQKFLYAKYGPGRAANPDFVRSDGRHGSSHMVQSSSFRYGGGFEPGPYGYAVDIGFWGAPQWDLLRTVMAEHGLRLTVFRPFEPWHFELDPAGPSAAETLFRFKADGSGVFDMQELLADQHRYMPNTIPDPGEPDGVFGPRTEEALIAWQELIGVEPDGSWGPDTERATADWLDVRTEVSRPGASGRVVRRIERHLRRARRRWPDEIPDPGDLDGEYDDQTAAAVEAWQTKLGIEADGVWGPATWEATDRFDDDQRV